MIGEVLGPTCSFSSVFAWTEEKDRKCSDAPWVPVGKALEVPFLGEPMGRGAGFLAVVGLGKWAALQVGPLAWVIGEANRWRGCPVSLCGDGPRDLDSEGPRVGPGDSERQWHCSRRNSLERREKIVLLSSRLSRNPLGGCFHLRKLPLRG